MTVVYYKVLKNDESFHGGEMKWSLPNGKPGKWHTHKGKLRMCSAGFHLTDRPIKWWEAGARVFEAEYKGKYIHGGADKICVRKVRLVRELAILELAELGIRPKPMTTANRYHDLLFEGMPPMAAREIAYDPRTPEQRYVEQVRMGG